MQTTTDCSVVAVFGKVTDAQAAVGELKSTGLSSDQIYVSSEGPATAASAGGAEYSQHEGGITGWFKSLFGSEEHEHRQGYEAAYAGGNTIVSVDTSEGNADRVSDILNRYSPVDVHTEDYGAAKGISTSNTSDAGYSGSRSEPSRSNVLNVRDEVAGAATTTGSAGVPTTKGNTGSTYAGAATGSAGVPPATKNTGSNYAGTSSAAASGEAIPVIEEELQVGKRSVQRGGVRVYSRLTETPVEENVNLREEHVKVNRQPVNRAATDADLRAGRDQVIEMKEFAEEAVVSKQARVVEEVRVGKEASERTETVRDSVRRTEIEVENLGSNSGKSNNQSFNDNEFRSYFASQYPSGSANYDDYAPAYRYGFSMANDPRYQGQDYSQIEPQLRQDYSSRYPNSTWEKMKDSVRYGWDKVTGKTSSKSGAAAR